VAQGLEDRAVGARGVGRQLLIGQGSARVDELLGGPNVVGEGVESGDVVITGGG
jgi:hypothetical protein